MTKEQEELVLKLNKSGHSNVEISYIIPALSTHQIAYCLRKYDKESPLTYAKKYGTPALWGEAREKRPNMKWRK